MNTLERAIEAVANTASDDPDGDNFEAVARAVLMAVREPDEATRWRMAEALTGETIHDTHFTAMIDAILSEGDAS